MKHAWLPLTALASITLVATAGPAQQAGTAARASASALPLAPYERLVPYKNGCNAILRTGETIDETTRQTRWLGACRFGLADGPGLLSYEGPYSDGKYYPQRMRFGRAIDTALVATYVTLPRGPGHDAFEQVMVASEIKRGAPSFGSVLDPYGKFAPDILSRSQRSDDAEQAVDIHWIVKMVCPTPYHTTMDAELASNGVGVPFDAPQRALVIPVCNKAIARLKAEGHVSGGSWSWGSDPFGSVDYGYFFVTYIEHQVSPRRGVDYDLMAGAKTRQYTDVALCPQITSLAGCEAVWRRLQAPFIAKRDALMAAAPRARADDLADLARRAAPLEAALRRQIATIVARYAARDTVAPRPAAPLPPRARPTPAKPVPSKGKRQ